MKLLLIEVPIHTYQKLSVMSITTLSLRYDSESPRKKMYLFLFTSCHLVTACHCVSNSLFYIFLLCNSIHGVMKLGFFFSAVLCLTKSTAALNYRSHNYLFFSITVLMIVFSKYCPMIKDICIDFMFQLSSFLQVKCQ